MTSTTSTTGKRSNGGKAADAPAVETSAPAVETDDEFTFVPAPVAEPTVTNLYAKHAAAIIARIGTAENAIRFVPKPIPTGTKGTDDVFLYAERKLRQATNDQGFTAMIRRFTADDGTAMLLAWAAPKIVRPRKVKVETPAETASPVPETDETAAEKTDETPAESDAPAVETDAPPAA